jgi:general secretion pathway protein L
VLPILAERDPERVLSYEMDRLTPFASSAVFWSWSAVQRDRARGRLHLRLCLIPRAPWQPVIDAFETIGLLVTALRAPAADGVMQRIGMRQARSTVAIWRRRGLQAIAAACVAMAILVIVLPFVQQHRAAIAAQRRIAQLRAPVAEVEALRRKIAGAEAGIDVVAAERARLGRPLRVLAAITDIFPDDTFLTDFTMRQGKLDMAGQSSGAAKLIAALAADPAIRNPAFAAPVNRLENGTADVFSIHAEAAP